METGDKIFLFPSAKDSQLARLDDGEDDLEGSVKSENSETPSVSVSVASSVSSQTKQKKRVSFPDDVESLVSIREIPPREDSPLSEELEPCDPEKLAEELNSMRLEVYKGKYDVGKASGRSLDIVAQITGIGKYDLSKAINKQATRTLNTAKKIEPIEKPEKPKSQEKVVLKSKKAAALKQMTASDELGEKLRVGNFRDVKSPKAPGRRHTGSTYVRSKDKKDALTQVEKQKKSKLSITGKEAGKLSKLKIARTENGNSYLRPSSASSSVIESYSEGYRTKRLIDLNTKDINSGAPLRLHSNQFQMVPKSNHLLSPYRQSSAEPFRSSSRCSIDTIALSEDGHDANTEGPRNLSRFNTRSVATSRTQRLYAWQLANGGLTIDNPLETPCISQMWDVPKQPLDTSLHIHSS